MQIRKFNLSQSLIWNNEIIYPQSGVNLIAVKLHIDAYSVEEVEKATKQVAEQTDIFCLRVVNGEGILGLALDEKMPYTYQVLDAMSQSEMKSYISSHDKMPLPPNTLYQISLIPEAQGGITLYARFHHIIMDGYSMTLFTQHVLDALEGKTVAKSSFFDSPEPLPYEQLEEDECFWKEYFQNADYANEYYPEEAKGLEKFEYPHVFEQLGVSNVEAYAKENGMTLAYMYLTAYVLYLSKVTGKKDAVILMSRLGRTKEEMHILGCFVLVIPVLVSLDGCESFEDAYDRVEKTAKQAAKHKNYGHGRIVKLCREMGLQTDGLSNHVFNYFDYKVKSSVPCKLNLNVGGAMYNHITLNIFSFHEQTVMALDMQNSIYDKSRAKGFATGMEYILQQVVEKTPMDKIQVVSKEEQQRGWRVKGEEIPWDTEATIVSLLEKVVKLQPEKPAVYAGEDGLTFQELDVLSSKIARGLIEKGVVAGDVIAFYLHRDIYLIPTMFAILKAGAVFVPIDTKYPLDRVNYIVEDSGAKYIISSKAVEKELEDWMDIDDLLTLGEVSDVNLGMQPSVKQESLAYIIYTSGTTGKPKGAMLSHRGIVNIVEPNNNPFNKEIVKCGHGIVAVGSIGFDISLFEILVPLCNGMFVELAPEEALVNPKRLAKLILAHGVDMMHCTPSRLAEYLKLPEFKNAFQEIRAVLSAGEVLYSSFVDELKETYGVKIFNGYGPTETTIGATITEAGDNYSIGKPIANVGIIILGKQQQYLPYGAIGEIGIYGAGMGLGYRNLEQETADKFCMIEGKKVYRTGDMGYLNQDEQLVYRGRNDRQVKLRGLRIELGEIEHCIGEFPGIRNVICMVRTIGKSKHLVVFFDANKETAIDVEELKGVLSKKLAHYMVPELIIRLEALPLTVSGKVDTKELDSYPIDIVKSYVAPTNETEHLVCSCYAEIVSSDVSEIGIKDNFFDIGGDSLGATMLVFRLEEHFGEGSVTVADIYECVTPEKIAKKLLGEDSRDEKNPLEHLEYSGFAEALQINKTEVGQVKSLGNVLLTGVTGFLGVHLLENLLKQPELFDKIYCVVRKKGRLEVKKRVVAPLFYFADDSYEDIYGSKWEVIEGDITDDGIYQSLEDIDIDTVINSAANVSHFAQGSELENTNTESVKKLIAFCLKKQAQLCQISTISVSGIVHKEKQNKLFTEADFFIGQEIQSKYILSKYYAEYLMIRAHVEENLPVKILRVGNLQGRINDGEFQMNVKSNAFSRRINSYMQLKAVPQEVYQSTVNFSPVDETARMIVSICASDFTQIAYHVYPPKEMRFQELFQAINALGYGIELKTDEEFQALVQEMRQTEEGRHVIEGILIERPNLAYKDVLVEDAITQKALSALGKCWAEITEEYLVKYTTALTNTLDF